MGPQLFGKTAGRDLCTLLWGFWCEIHHECVKHSRVVEGKMSTANCEVCMSLQPLKMHCRSCALVTSSGHLLGSRQGDRIDESECVIRMNDAPTRGYGKDVGNKTSLRVIAHSSIQRILRNRNELLNMSHGAVFIFWGPSSYMRRDGKGLVYNNLQLMNQILPQLKVYMISRHKMLQFDDLFKRETGKDRWELTWIHLGMSQSSKIMQFIYTNFRSAQRDNPAH